MDIAEKKSIYLFLLLASIILVLGVWGTNRLIERPGLKADFETTDEHLYLTQLSPGSQASKAGIKVGDILLEVNGNKILSSIDLNFYLDQKRIGEAVRFSVQRDSQKFDLVIPLERKNNWPFLLVNFLDGLFVWVVGIFVFLKNPKSQVTRILLFASLSFSLALFISWEGFPFGPSLLSFILPSLQMIAYTLSPALFLHFSVIFPREEEMSSQKKPLIYSIYLPSLALILLMESFYWRAILGNSLTIFQTYKTLFLYDLITFSWFHNQKSNIYNINNAKV